MKLAFRNLFILFTFIVCSFNFHQNIAFGFVPNKNNVIYIKKEENITTISSLEKKEDNLKKKENTKDFKNLNKIKYIQKKKLLKRTKNWFTQQ